MALCVPEGSRRVKVYSVKDFNALFSDFIILPDFPSAGRIVVEYIDYPLDFANTFTRVLVA